MSNIEQVNDNTSFMKDFVPMNDKEKVNQINRMKEIKEYLHS